METITDKINQIWIKELEKKNSPVNMQNQIQYDIQDIGFLVSQLIEPTLSIVIQFAALYICIQNDIKVKENQKQQIKKGKRVIEEILENYNVDVKNIDELVDSIITQLKEI